MSLWLALPAAVVGLVLVLLIRRRLWPANRVVIGERGILRPDLGWGWIPWDEIEGAYTPGAEESDTLRVRLRVTDRLAHVLRRRRQRELQRPVDGSLEIRLDLAGSELSAVELLQEILSRQASQPRP